MNAGTIANLLTNSGLNVLKIDTSFVYIEDPTCVIRSFETFAGYAWIALSVVTALLLFGWGISLVRGSANDYFNNLKNLILIFGTVSAAPLIINLLWGGDLFGLGCKTVSVPVEEIQKILDTQKNTLEKYNEFSAPESLELSDSGLPFDQASVNDESVDTTESASDYPPSNSGVNNNFISASDGDNNSVIYTDKAGQKLKYIGGTRAWRNNNPGNLRYYDFAKKHGAIGEAGGFAVFPDVETGTKAQRALLLSNSYINLTISAVIEKYAPTEDNNNVNAYVRSLEKKTGLKSNRTLKSLTEQEMNSVIETIQLIEGWKAGKIQKL